MSTGKSRPDYGRGKYAKLALEEKRQGKEEHAKRLNEAVTWVQSWLAGCPPTT